MPQSIVELYSDEEIERLRRRVRRHTVFVAALAAAALAACIAFAVLANTANAGQMELAAVLTSTLAGWVCIYDGTFIVGAGRKELAHADMLRTEPRTRLAGRVTVGKERLRIRGSVTVRLAEVDTGAEDGPQKIYVQENHAKLLQNAGVTAVYTAHSYAAAVEVSA